MQGMDAADVTKYGYTIRNFDINSEQGQRDLRDWETAAKIWDYLAKVAQSLNRLSPEAIEQMKKAAHKDND